MKQPSTVGIRVTAKNYYALRKVARETRTPLSGLVNFIVELYLNDRRVNTELSAAPVITATSSEANG